jgi:DNA replication protein DnaC
MPESPHNPVKIFFSYSHKDKHLRDKLEEQLSLLKNQGLVSTWHDREIFAGEEFDKEISEHLEEADLILLLVSPPFIASKYCYEKEMGRALEKHEAKEAHVIPVILRPCDWQTAPFGNLKALPEDGKPVTTWQNRDRGFLNVARGIRKYIETHKSSSDENNNDPTDEDSQNRAKYFLELPSSVVGFVPRQYREGEDFVNSLVTELKSPETEILVLWGAGGVGKTTLAAQAARNLQTDKKVIWINADNRADVSVGGLLDDIAGGLDYPEFRQYPAAKKREQVLYILREKPSVVMLDNFETVSPESQIECLEFLKLSGFVSLITTRDRIEGVKNRQINEMLEGEAQEFLSRLI